MPLRKPYRDLNDELSRYNVLPRNVNLMKFYGSRHHSWRALRYIDDPISLCGMFRLLVDWSSVDGFTVGGDSGYSVTPRGCDVKVTTGSTANYDAYIRSVSQLKDLQAVGKKFLIEWILTELTSVYNLNAWIRIEYTSSDPPSETVYHYGFKIINADLYASVGNNTNQTIADTGVNLSAEDQVTLLRAEVDPTVGVGFFVNNIATNYITTNLPNIDDYTLTIHVRTTGVGGKSLYMGQVLVEREI